MSREPAFSSGNQQVQRETQAFLAALAAAGGKPMEQLTPEEARAVLVGAQEGVELELPPADVTTKSITVDGVEITLTIVRPQGVQETLPAFMFFHGGGWVIGDYPTHERFIRDLVVESGAAAVYVDYTRSPEARYPVAIEQAYAATKWVAEHGAELNLDGSRLAVVGNSAGGNLANAVSLLAKQRSGPALRFQALLWPVTDANLATDSYQRYAEGHFLTKAMMEWFWNHYTAKPAQRKEIFAAPLQATAEELRGLPPTLIQTAENDVLRDEGEAYARKLDAAGVPVTATRYLGMIHDFGLLNALSKLAGTRSALLQVASELKKHLA